MESMIAVDVGNSRIKFGFFRDFTQYQCTELENSTKKFPKPDSVLIQETPDLTALCAWLRYWATKPTTWLIAPTGHFNWNLLQIQIAEYRPDDCFTEIINRDIPILNDVEQLEHVGCDRLLAALGAAVYFSNSPDRQEKIVVVDTGTAVTIDVVSCGGELCQFQGGAILPGLRAAGHVLSQIAPKLPEPDFLKQNYFETETNKMILPVYPGKNTQQAIHAGIYWGVIGAIRQFCEIIEIENNCTVSVCLTGGDSELLYAGLSPFICATKIPFLVLTGIALTAKFLGFNR